MLDVVYDSMNTKFNLLKLILHRALSHRTAVRRYHNEYKFFLRYIRTTYQDLVRKVYSDKRVPVFTVNIGDDDDYDDIQRQQRLPPNTIIISGQETYYRYVAVKCVMARVIEYEKCLSTYVSHVDNSLIKLVNGMNNFITLFTRFLQIIGIDTRADGKDFEMDVLQDIEDKTQSESFTIRRV